MTSLVPSPGGRCVALGSSFAAGPGITPRVDDAPRRSGRSRRNYSHLLAARLGLELHDATWSGATAADLRDQGEGAPCQLDVLDERTDLVTLTCGGNDVGYVATLTLASLPGARWLPWVRRGVAGGVAASDARFAVLPALLDRLLDDLRDRAPRAVVLVVDYLTLLPPAGQPAPPLSPAVADWGRDTSARLADETAAAARRAGALLVPAASASREHHAWSSDPWTTRPALGRGVPLHPTAAGMAAVADLAVEVLAQGG